MPEGDDHGAERSSAQPQSTAAGTRADTAMRCQQLSNPGSAHSAVPLLLIFGLFALAPGFLSSMSPAIIKTDFHLDMCPNITAVTNSSLGTSNDGYKLKASKDSLNGVWSFIGAVFFGQVADSMSRKSLIMIGLIGSTLPYLALALTCDNAYYIPLASFSGATDSALFIGVSSFIADLVPSAHRAVAFGAVLICPVIALAISSPLGALCAAAYKETSVQVVFWTAAVMSISPVRT